MAYIDRLPSWSALVEAQAQDEEIAELYAGQEPGPAPSPRILEWTPERAELVKIHEAVRGLTAVVLGFMGGNGEMPPPDPRPETAADRLAAKVEEASYDYLLDLIEEARNPRAE